MESINNFVVLNQETEILALKEMLNNLGLTLNELQLALESSQIEAYEANILLDQAQIIIMQTLMHPAIAGG